MILTTKYANQLVKKGLAEWDGKCFDDSNGYRRYYKILNRLDIHRVDHVLDERS